MTSPRPAPWVVAPEMAASPFALWSPPYIGVKCGPLPQRNLLQLWVRTIAGKRLEEHFFFISRLQPTLAMHPGPPFDLLRRFGLQLWAAAQFNCPLPPPGGPVGDHPRSFASRCGATPTMVSNWPLGNTLPSGRLHEVVELKFGSGAVMGAY